MARNINALHPNLQEKLKQLNILCSQNQLNIGIGECFRTVDEQDALYAQGRTKPGNIVTNTKGSSYSSQHQWGIAFDFFKNEKGHEFDDLLFFTNVSKLAKSIGLAWGGDWNSFKDRPHLYLPNWGSTTQRLKALYGTPEKFIATWSSPSPTVSTSSSKQSFIAAGQLHINNFTGAGIATDGIRGKQTKKAGIMAWQLGLSKDYNSELKIDGIAGRKTKDAMKGKSIRKGQKGYLVTALEILLMLKDYKAGGVEYPGIFGNNLDKALRRYQKLHGLTEDGIAGIRTFESLTS